RRQAGAARRADAQPDVRPPCRGWGAGGPVPRHAERLPRKPRPLARAVSPVRWAPDSSPKDNPLAPPPPPPLGAEKRRGEGGRGRGPGAGGGGRGIRPRRTPLWPPPPPRPSGQRSAGERMGGGEGGQAPPIAWIGADCRRAPACQVVAIDSRTVYRTAGQSP